MGRFAGKSSGRRAEGQQGNGAGAMDETRPRQHAGRYAAASAVQEVLPVASSESDSSADEMEQDELQQYHSGSDESGSDEPDTGGEESGEERAVGWGKRRRDFYDADYTGDQRAELGESDEEAAQLEEAEATSLQAQLARQIQPTDYTADLQLAQDPSEMQPQQQEQDGEDPVVAQPDAAQGTQTRHEQLLATIDARSHLLDEAEQFGDWLRPILEQCGAAGTPLSAALQAALAALRILLSFGMYSQYFKWLQRDGARAQLQPCAAALARLLRLVPRAAAVLHHYKDDILLLHQRTSEHTLNAEQLSLLLAAHTQEPRGQLGQKAVQHSEHEQAVDDGQLQLTETDGAGGRAISQQIARGSAAPHKGRRQQRHSRVKLKRSYAKAAYRKRTQVPEVRRELHKYTGERRGIKSTLVSSVPLQ